MLKTMRKTSLESEFIKKSEGEKIFRSMLDEQYAIISAKSGSLGLGEMIFQGLWRLYIILFFILCLRFVMQDFHCLTIVWQPMLWM